MTGDTPSTIVNATEAAQSVPASAPSCLPGTAVDTRPPRPAKADPDRVRLCIVTRAELPPAQLIRFVLGPDDRIVPDLAQRLPGRGVWVTATRPAVADAVKRGLFAKSLKQNVKADKDLPDQVDKLLGAETRQVLSLANKAGLVTTGFSKVEIALERGEAAALITASDASADGAGKLARKFRAIRGAAQLDAPIIGDLTSDELSLAIGGSNVIHAAIARGGAGGGLGRRFISCCQRLRHYRMKLDDAGIAGASTGSPDAASDGIQKHDIERPRIEQAKSHQAGTDHE